MTNCCGEVQEIPSFHFQWMVPNISPVLKHHTWYYSPNFECGDAVWKIVISPQSRRFPGWLWASVILEKLSSECSKHIMTFTCSIKDKDGKNYTPEKSVKGEFFKKGDIQANYIVELSKLLKELSMVSPENILTISCTLSWDRSIGTKEQLSNEKRSIEEKELSKNEEKELGKEGVPIPRGIDKTIQDFKSLLLNEHDCDVTLKVQDQEFRAHKLILGVRSPVFSSMFKHDTVESSGVVDIPDCNPDSFKDFLVYIYSGRIDKINSNKICSLYTIADKYGVDYLKMDCLEVMKEELSVDIFGDVIDLAVRHNESALIESATVFFKNNLKKILMSVKWQSFLNGNPTAANELCIKAIPD